jgi:hypothetical protein
VCVAAGVMAGTPKLWYTRETGAATVLLTGRFKHLISQSSLGGWRTNGVVPSLCESSAGM